MHTAPARLGLDLGSTAVHAAMIDADGRLLGGRSRSSAGRPLAALDALLAEIEADWGAQSLPVGTTGTAGGLLAGRAQGLQAANDIVAVAKGASRLCPSAASAQANHDLLCPVFFSPSLSRRLRSVVGFMLSRSAAPFLPWITPPVCARTLAR